jgi:hypothetical protein
MRIGSGARIWAAIVVAGGLAGCGGSGANIGATGAARSAVSVGSTGAANTGVSAQTGSATCQTSLTRSTRPCVFVLSDGTRLRCPQTFGHVVSGTETLELTSACRRLRPLAIPLSWRVVFSALATARSCLANEGLKVAGGPSLGLPGDSPQTPIGELSIANGEAPTLIGFYVNSRVARESESTARRKLEPFGQVARHDEAIILWTRRPTSAQREITESCAFRPNGRS